MIKAMNLFVAVFETVCLLLLFRFFAPPRFKWVGRYWGAVLVALVVGYVNYGLLGLRLNMFTNAALAIGLFACIGLALYRMKVLYAFFISAFGYFLKLVVEYVWLACLAYFLTGSDIQALLQSVPYFILGFFGSRLLYFICMVAAGRAWGKRQASGYLQYISNRYWLMLFVFPLITVLSIFTMTTVGGLDNVQGIVIIACLLLLFSNLLLFFIVESIGRSAMQAQQFSVMQRQYADSLESSSALLGMAEKQRALIHDFKHHASAMQQLLAEGRYEALEEYLSDYDIRQPALYRLVTGHPMMDAVLNQKDYTAQKQGVTLVLSAGNMAEFPMKDVHIVALLSNTLDNAIEAAAKVTAADKTVRIKLAREPNGWLYAVVNPVQAPVRIVNGGVKTTKRSAEGHGYGLMNVREVIEQYKGDCFLECEGGSFVFSCVLPTP